MRTATITLAFLCSTSAAHAEVAIINPDSMHPDLELVIIPASPSAVQVARSAHLPLETTPWADMLARQVPGAVGGLEPSPFGELTPLQLLTPGELCGMSGIPVMMEGDGRSMLRPFARGLTVTTDLASAGYQPAGWDPPDVLVAHLEAWREPSGWKIASAAGGAAESLTGVLSATWIVDGVALDGFGVLVDDNGSPVALLGRPLLRNRPLAGVHLVGAAPLPSP